MYRSVRIIALLFLLLALAAPTSAASATPASQAEAVRALLLNAQLAMNSAPAEAEAAVAAAESAYASGLGVTLQTQPTADSAARAALAAARTASAARDAAALAAARGAFWGAVLGGSTSATIAAAQAGDATTARQWLTLREFRQATRFSRPNTSATEALTRLERGQLDAAAAAQSVQADLFDTYQARLIAALHDLGQADSQQFAVRRAELAALSQGYFAMLAPAMRQQQGDTADTALGAFAELARLAAQGQPVAAQLAVIEPLLEGFRAAPLSAEEQARRAGQLLRFLSLVPVEYGRGVSSGKVTQDLEIREATTFRDGAAAAFADLQPALRQRNADATAQVAATLGTLEAQLASASTHTAVADPATVQQEVDSATALLRQTMPAEWQRHDSSADFDVIASALDQMEAAVAAGQYELAESARLEAYAILESGPEAKLIVFAPQMKQPIEDLFWFGQGEQVGLASLIEQRAPASAIKASRRTLDTQLAEAQQALAGNNAPVAVATNAGVIVFREGLEAVLILASLMGSLKTAEQRRYRKPMWWGVVLAFAASILTFVLAQGLLTSLARYGEKLEAVVSLVAIGVLLLITNWFFHQVYWTDWMASFHQQKRRIIGGAAGQFLGLMTLGFTSIYREGFETVLFLQALVLESGAAVVLLGTALGLLATLAVGVVVFALQAKLPYKKMLIYTGVLIGAVLLQMVGNTVHVMQVVGWMPIHPIRWLELPYWAGMWFGVYATWEGLALQTAAAVFVIGSYVLAEGQKHRARKAAPQTPPTRAGATGV